MCLGMNLIEGFGSRRLRAITNMITMLWTCLSTSRLKLGGCESSCEASALGLHNVREYSHDTKGNIHGADGSACLGIKKEKQVDFLQMMCSCLTRLRPKCRGTRDSEVS